MAKKQAKRKAAGQKKTTAKKTAKKTVQKTAKKTVKKASSAMVKKPTVKKADPAVVATGLQSGDLAPAFKVQSDSGEWVSLQDFKGKTVVLYFYPKDDTPGCTKES